MPPRRKEKKYCLLCNSELFLNKLWRRYPKNFCSKLCSIKYYVGDKSWNYKNGRVEGEYARILVDGKYIREHRYLMEKVIGRKLNKGEVVHHIDGNSRNNSISNLALMESGEHTRLHVKGKRHKKTKYPICIKLPIPNNEGEILSILPEYRTYITIVCSGCKKLYWMRKDYLLRQSRPSCSSHCGHIVQGHHVNS